MTSKSHTPPLPSLRALHAFTTVARTRSSAAAAEFLGVTPSAISHLMRELEERLGIGLFDRNLGRFVLTEEGQRLHQDIARAFDEIEDSVRRVLRQRSDLRISTVDTFAQFWLIPRLTEFQREAPAVDLYISTTPRVVDLDVEGIDAAIRWGAGHWPRTKAERLSQDLLLPVAHPRLAARLKRPTPAAIAQLPLVHARTLPDDWNLWFRSVGHADLAGVDGLVMESRGHVISAALAGVGAIVMDTTFIQDELSSGRLVALSDSVVRRHEGYWLVWSENRLPRQPLRHFATWLKKEFSRIAPDANAAFIDAEDGAATPRNAKHRPRGA